MGVMCTVYCTVYCVLCNTPSVIYLQQARKNHTPHTLTPSRTTPPPHAFARQHTHTHPPPNTPTPKQSPPLCISTSTRRADRHATSSFSTLQARSVCANCAGHRKAHIAVSPMSRAPRYARPRTISTRRCRCGNRAWRRSRGRGGRIRGTQRRMCKGWLDGGVPVAPDTHTPTRAMATAQFLYFREHAESMGKVYVWLIRVPF